MAAVQATATPLGSAVPSVVPLTTAPRAHALDPLIFALHAAPLHDHDVRYGLDHINSDWRRAGADVRAAFEHRFPYDDHFAVRGQRRIEVAVGDVSFSRYTVTYRN